MPASASRGLRDEKSSGMSRDAFSSSPPFVIWRCAIVQNSSLNEQLPTQILPRQACGRPTPNSEAKNIKRQPFDDRENFGLVGARLHARSRVELKTRVWSGRNLDLVRLGSRQRLNGSDPSLTRVSKACPHGLRTDSGGCRFSSGRRLDALNSSMHFFLSEANSKTNKNGFFAASSQREKRGKTSFNCALFENGRHPHWSAAWPPRVLETTRRFYSFFKIVPTDHKRQQWHAEPWR